MAATSEPLPGSISGSIFEALGGIEGCRKLSAAFYARVAADPVLRPVFGSSFHCAVEALATYIVQLSGGPCLYSPKRWSLSLRESHLRFRIGPAEQEAWMKTMRQAMEETAVPAEAQTALLTFFEAASVPLINQKGPLEVPAAAIAGHRLSAQWDAHQAIEEAVTAVRAGDAPQAIALAEGPILEAYFQRDRSALASLLALMSGRPEDGFASFIEKCLTANPSLAGEETFYSRTLLHDAAAAGGLRTVELLLSLGADPNGGDIHPPLYCVANQCGGPAGAAIVRALIQAGADVHSRDRLKRCTPLHMAARRGFVAIAEALLAGGADLEARDSAGETPLRRAVNCGKAELAAFLLARGADPHSRGSRNLTPATAARTDAMKRVFASGRSPQAQNDRRRLPAKKV